MSVSQHPPEGTRPLSPSDSFDFERFGTSYHLKLHDAASLETLLALDDAHWVATSAPLSTLNAEPSLLAYLDADNDGRIDVAEVRQAVTWLLSQMRNHKAIKAHNLTVRLDDLGHDEEAQQLREMAQRILTRADKTNHAEITLEEVQKVKKSEQARGMSEAGVLLPAAVPDEDLQALFEDIIATVGGVSYSDHQTGVTKEHLEAFLSVGAALQNWRARAVEEASVLMPLGEDTGKAWELLAGLETKIEEYFLLAQAAQQDPALAGPLDGHAHLDTTGLNSAEATRARLERAPLSNMHPEALLNFDAPLNPNHRKALRRLQNEVLKPLQEGQAPNTLSHEGWEALKARFEPHKTWRSQKPEHPQALDQLDPTRLDRWLNEPQWRTRFEALFEESHRSALVFETICQLERLILYQGLLLPFVNSFVSFPHLYEPASRALFEMGSLVMDGRHFTLAVRVPERTRHIKMSDTSNMFVLYVEVSATDGALLYEVAVPVTAGGRKNLQVGKRGVFHALDGKVHHAVVVHIVDNPIGMREALLAPFKRLGAALEELTRKLSSKSEEAFQNTVISKSTTSPPTAQAPAAAPTTTPTANAAKTPNNGSGNMLAGGGIALAALGSSLAFVLQTLSTLTWLQILAGLSLLVLSVLAPSALVAWLKLRRRDLSSILEGSGWAINARMRLTRKQARMFTFTPDYPAGATGTKAHWLGWLLTLLGFGAVVALWVWYLKPWG